jgi:hypothetical protein
MPGTARPILSRCSVGVAGAAAVIVLAACGGSATPAAKTTDVEGTDAATSAAPSAADFCTQAAGIDHRVDAALSDLEAGDPSLADAFRQVAVELRQIDAPEPITAEWAAMAAGLDRMAEAVADLDITDLDSLESLDRAEVGLNAASAEVESYLSDECGL